MARFMALWHRALVIAFCITLLVLWNAGDRLTARQLLAIDNSASSRQANPPCRSLPGAEDTLVVLETGSTELKDRLPVHLSTTLQCYQHYMIFSDFEESFESEHIIDALESVSPEILNDHDDFELWRRLQQGGRSVLESSELSGPESEAVESIGKSKNPGWKLDKWKFLPMMNRTFHDHPDMKWYVFAEADTYLLWASLLEYLAVLDHTKPHYSGSQMFIGDTLFAHGGSGFVVSQPAMRLVIDRFEIHQREIESYTDNHWAGDCVLGKVFNDAGVQFTNAWPIMQGDYPGIVAYARPDGRPIADPNMRQWCYPVVSYHHMTPDEIEDMWHFEQGWLALNRTNESRFLRHKDVFKQYILPRMKHTRDDWNNECDREEGIVGSLDECRAKCESVAECKQYSVDEGSLCRSRIDARLGKASEGFKSGWLHDRMMRFEQDMAPCGDEGWLT